MFFHRYYTERYVSGIKPVVPLDPSEYKKSLGPAYKKGWYSPRWWGERKADCKVGSAYLNNVSAVYQDVKSEINRKQSYEDFCKYVEKNYHSKGHIIVGKACAKNGQQSQMAYSEAAARDPIFYRWHKHLEDLVQEFRDKQLPK